MSSRSRRSTLALWRDALLVLTMEGKPIKRTNFMYALGMSWSPCKKLVADLLAKRMIELIGPLEIRRRNTPQGNVRRKDADGRTSSMIEITQKGRYALRWIDELLKFINSPDTDVRPPLWVLQSLYRGNTPQLGVHTRAELEFKLIPVYLAGSVDLAASFEVRRKSNRMFCPECRKEVSGLRGLKIHVGKMHAEKKEEILAALAFYLKQGT